MHSLDLKKPQLYGPFLWMTFNCLKATEPLRGGSLLFTSKFPETPGTYLIDVRRMKGCDPVILNTGSLDWESSALTTWPLLHKLDLTCQGPINMWNTLWNNMWTHCGIW